MMDSVVSIHLSTHVPDVRYQVREGQQWLTITDGSVRINIFGSPRQVTEFLDAAMQAPCEVVGDELAYDETPL